MAWRGVNKIIIFSHIPKKQKKDITSLFSAVKKIEISVYFSAKISKYFCIVRLINYDRHIIDKNMLVYNKTCNNKKTSVHGGKFNIYCLILYYDV